LGLVGVFMDTALLRSGRNEEIRRRLDEGWPDDGLHATLDFYEAEEGMLFLEGGPAHAIGGGGHPCAFAGQGTTGHPMEDPARCEGVAYRNMPHVHLAEPKTWKDGDPEGCIEGWEAAARRAAEFGPLDDDMRSLLAMKGVSTGDGPSPS